MLEVGARPLPDQGQGFLSSRSRTVLEDPIPENAIINNIKAVITF